MRRVLVTVGGGVAGPQVTIVYVILQRGKGLDPTDPGTEGRSASWRAGIVRRFWGLTGELCDSPTQNQAFRHPSATASGKQGLIALHRGPG